MRNSTRPLGRAVVLCSTLVILFFSIPLHAAEAPRLRADNYVIDVELIPKTHKLVARAKVQITALETIGVATFELHNGLRPTRISNAAGQALSAERVTRDSALRVALPAGLEKGQSATLTFDYEGVLASADDSPVEGLKLAYVGEDTSYLLYSSRWFPVVEYGTNRFTATINVTVPATFKVIGSGIPVRKPSNTATTTYTFQWDRPSFPGTIIAGQFVETSAEFGGLTVHTYFKAKKKDLAPVYAETAAKEYDFFSSLYGAAPSGTLKIVELPDDAVPAAWAPEIAAIASRAIDEKTNYRLLANTLARQWWGVSVSPATRNDFWINDGFARYSEVRYVEEAAGKAAFEEAAKDLSVGALAYDVIPISSSGKLDLFSPEFQSLVTDKGGAILHMLRWVIGEDPYNRTMRRFAEKFAGKSARTEDFRAIAEEVTDENLTGFFNQWLDGTGAPDFKNKYSVYRISKGFRVVGEVSQDLDLFRMPMEVRIDTDGPSETKRIEVVGTKSPYAIETFGKPRHIELDPNNWVLKNTGDLKVRVSVLRGQQLVAQGDYGEALKEFNKALEANQNSSLAHYRIAEVFFLQRNYQAAANAYRSAMNGDGEPRWTQVWSHIQLGKIYDVTGQRERAANEYRQALQTNDNTEGALDEARKYLTEPYKGGSSGS